MSEGQTSAAAFPSPGAPGGAVGWPGPPSARPQLPRAAPFPVTGPTGRQPHRYQPFRVQPRHRGRKPPTVNPHRGRLIPIGAGNHPLGQANNLPQCTVTYPDATTHPPQQRPATEKQPHLPTPITHCLPQCDNAPAPAAPGHGETTPFAYPNEPLPTPMRARPPQCGPAQPGGARRARPVPRAGTLPSPLSRPRTAFAAPGPSCARLRRSAGHEPIRPLWPSARALRRRGAARCGRRVR